MAAPTSARPRMDRPTIRADLRARGRAILESADSCVGCPPGAGTLSAVEGTWATLPESAAIERPAMDSTWWIWEEIQRGVVIRPAALQRPSLPHEKNRAGE